MPVAFGQAQLISRLQLCQQVALAVIEGCRAQGRIAVEFIEQGFGGELGVQGLLGQLWVGNQSADGLQGLGRHALLGDPVGSADERQVGDQQDGDQQHQQGCQQLLADWQVFQAFAQGHGRVLVLFDECTGQVNAALSRSAIHGLASVRPGAGATVPDAATGSGGVRQRDRRSPANS
ncbi:hypothetical protein D3C76_1285340 [compost metagenome]